MTKHKNKSVGRPKKITNRKTITFTVEAIEVEQMKLNAAAAQKSQTDYFIEHCCQKPPEPERPIDSSDQTS